MADITHQVDSVNMFQPWKCHGNNHDRVVTCTTNGMVACNNLNIQYHSCSNQVINPSIMGSYMCIKKLANLT